MKSQIQVYNNFIENKLKEDNTNEEWDKISEDYLVKINFYQHERLVHLIVTALFALMETIVITATVITESIGLMVLCAAILTLLIPYVAHYYFLENTVQKMYLIYDKINERIKR
ncbi:MAG: hypothetical protein K1W00_12465 [Lachnospiraceae bacterium]